MPISQSGFADKDSLTGMVIQLKEKRLGNAPRALGGGVSWIS